MCVLCVVCVVCCGVVCGVLCGVVCVCCLCLARLGTGVLPVPVHTDAFQTNTWRRFQPTHGVEGQWWWEKGGFSSLSFSLPLFSSFVLFLSTPLCLNQ